MAILNKQKVIEGSSVTFYLDNKLEGSIYDSILNRINSFYSKDKNKNKSKDIQARGKSFCDRKII